MSALRIAPDRLDEQVDEPRPVDLRPDHDVRREAAQAVEVHDRPAPGQLALRLHVDAVGHLRDEAGRDEPGDRDRVVDGRAIPAVALAVECLLYTSPSPRDRTRSRMPSS